MKGLIVPVLWILWLFGVFIANCFGADTGISSKELIFAQMFISIMIWVVTELKFK